jgi:hypothetical protein
MTVEKITDDDFPTIGAILDSEEPEMKEAEAIVRAAVVDELRNLGVISEKKARKRLMKIAQFLPPLEEK